MTVTAIPRTVPHDNAELVPFSPPSTPDVPPPSLTAPVRINESAVVPPPSSCAHQTATENFHNSSTSPDPTTPTTTRDNLSALTMPRTGPETSTSTLSVCLTGERSLQNVAGLLVHPDAPEAPSPASREPVLNDITGSSFYLTDSRSTDFHCSPSSPESHCSLSLITRPGASPRPTSAHEHSTVEGSPKAGSHEDKYALVNHPIQANSMTTLDHQPRPSTPILPLTTDINITGPLQQGLDTEHAVDPPLHGSHGQRDGV